MTCSASPSAQQAVIDEDAGELFADRLVQQHGDDRRVDAARQAADHAPAADLGADPLDRLLPERRHRPVAGAARDTVCEIPQQVRARRRVHDLRMELDAVKAPGLVGDGGEGCPLAGADDPEPFGQGNHPVAVAHPHLVGLARLPDPVEQPRSSASTLHRRPAELAMVGGFDGTAQDIDHGLLAIADAEHRQAELEDDWRRGGRAFRRHRGRAAGQDNGRRAELADRRFADTERVNFRIDAGFPDPAGDQLRHLRAEIENQDAVGHGGVGGREIVVWTGL